MDRSTDFVCPSHPFIDFRLDLSALPASFWARLGIAKARCQAIADAPLGPEIRRHMHDVWLARGAVATTAIEGYELTEDVALKMVTGNPKIPAALEYDAQAVRNIISACNSIIDHHIVADGRVTLEALCQFNAMALHQLPVEAPVKPGVIRDYQVSVGQGIYTPPPAAEVEVLLQRYVEWLDQFPQDIGVGDKIECAIIKAIMAHLYLAWIHPFGDGNGRAARLVELTIMWHGGVTTAVAHLLSNHYNQTRQRYYRQLDRASKPGGVAEFLAYAIEGLAEGLQDQLDWITAQHRGLVWRELVNAALADQRGEARKRREIIATRLGEDAVPAQLLMLTIPELVSLYANKTKKTVSRDLNTLVRLELLSRSEDGYRARFERVMRFLPRKAQQISAPLEGGAPKP